jgi:hypothetical protein
MSTISHEPSRVLGQDASWTLRLLVRELWASLAIVVMWLSVLFAAVYGPAIETRSAAGETMSLPCAVPVALFAFLATWVVAKHGFAQYRKASD